MQKKMRCFLFIGFILFHAGIYAQDSNIVPQNNYRVAVFAPLYLDSVFSDNKLKSENIIPRFIMPGVEFVQGAIIAFDTLSAGSDHIEAMMYDTKSYLQPVSWLIKNKLLDSLNLIIGSVKDSDYKELADFAQYRNIPFISATYPNDGGVTGNPYLTIMNSTLKAHCEGIYSYILQNHGTDKVYLVKKSGPQEDKIAGYFKTLNEQEGKPLLKIQTISVDSTVSSYLLKSRLDSNHNTVIIGASLDEYFAKNLTDAIFALKKKYPVTLIGMPNWDGFKTFTKKDAYKDFPIHFTSPYYNSKIGYFNTTLTNEYNKRYKSKPSDMAYKGFETAYYFTKLLLKYPKDILLHLNDSSLKVFNDFNFRPVYLKKGQATNPDYQENKHLYVIRILNGTVSREW
ncbi:MAG: ABC transporter substrate-binding protein [Ginsengibacter sp.]